MGIEGMIKAYKDTPDADMAIYQPDYHDFKLAEWEHQSTYPLLYAKSAKHSVAEPPHFTSGESQEREQLVKLLYEANNATRTHAFERLIAK